MRRGGSQGLDAACVREMRGKVLVGELVVERSSSPQHERLELVEADVASGLLVLDLVDPLRNE